MATYDPAKEERQNNFLRWLNDAKAELGVTNEELAKKLGISTGTVKNYLNDSSRINNTERFVRCINEFNRCGNYHHMDIEQFSKILQKLYGLFSDVLSQQALAELTGTDVSIISKYTGSKKKGGYLPPLRTETQKLIIDHYLNTAMKNGNRDVVRYIERVYGKAALQISIDKTMADCRCLTAETQKFLEKVLREFMREHIAFYKCNKISLSLRPIKLLDELDSVNEQMISRNKIPRMDNRYRSPLFMIPATEEGGSPTGHLKFIKVYYDTVGRPGDITDKSVLPILREICDNGEFIIKMLERLDLWLNDDEVLQKLSEVNLTIPPKRRSGTVDTAVEFDEQCRAFAELGAVVCNIVLDNMRAFCDWRSIRFRSWRLNMELFRSLPQDKKDKIVARLEGFEEIRLGDPAYYKEPEWDSRRSKFSEITAYRRMIELADDIRRKLKDPSKKEVSERALKKFSIATEYLFYAEGMDVMEEITYKLGFSAYEWYVWMLFATAEYRGMKAGYFGREIMRLSGLLRSYLGPPRKRDRTQDRRRHRSPGGIKEN